MVQINDTGRIKMKMMILFFSSHGFAAFVFALQNVWYCRKVYVFLLPLSICNTVIEWQQRQQSSQKLNAFKHRFVLSRLENSSSRFCSNGFQYILHIFDSYIIAEDVLEIQTRLNSNNFGITSLDCLKKEPVLFDSQRVVTCK